ncbi:MAG: hybrid sensor histidine kinase/response regulator [Dichotomicrobium sp.]
MPESPYIAIIDDLSANRAYLERLARSVEDVGRVESFAGAPKALRAFAADPPDLIVTDFNMPDMNAAQCLTALRQISGLEETPVMVVSSYEQRDIRYKALECGATDFLVTPVDTIEFRTRARNLLMLGLHQKLLRSRMFALQDRLVSHRLRSLKTLKRTREHMLGVIDSVPAMVYALDEEGTCIFANQYCFDFAGRSESGSLSDLREMFDRVAATGVLEKLAEGSPQQAELTLTDGAGQAREFLVVARKTATPEGDGATNVVSALDVSSIKAAELSLRIAKDEAEAANRAKSNFLANMSHELRTPMNAIIGFADMMRSGLFGEIPNDKYNQYLDSILYSARHLLSIINGILDFAQMEAGKTRVEETVFSLHHCLYQVSGMLNAQLGERGNALSVPEEPDVVLWTDEQKLRQVLINILSNANKFTENGTIRVELCVGSDNTQEHCAHADGVEIRITDTGAGMSEEQMGTALTSFGEILEQTFEEPKSGTGLGLPISAGFMKLMGGTLDIESAKGAGTTVRLWLPPRCIVKQTGPPAETAGEARLPCHASADR